MDEPNFIKALQQLLSDEESARVLQHILDSFPGHVLLKDKNSQYIHGNCKLAELLNLDSPADLQGLTDSDIEVAAAKHANEHIMVDQEVMHDGKTKVGLVLHQYADSKSHLLLGFKSPLKDHNGETIGVICYSLDLLEHPELLQFFMNRVTEGIMQTKLSKDLIFDMNIAYESYGFSKRESEVLFYTLRGYTWAKTAEQMKLSPRTIEAYLESLKNKVGVSSKSELIAKAVSLGFVNHIPLSVCDFQQSPED